MALMKKSEVSVFKCSPHSKSGPFPFIQKYRKLEFEFFKLKKEVAKLEGLLLEACVRITNLENKLRGEHR